MLTDSEKEGFIRDGYLRVPGLLTGQEVASVKEAVLTALGMDQADPATWQGRDFADAAAIRATEPARNARFEAVAEALVGPDFVRGVCFSPFLEGNHRPPIIRPGFIPVFGFPTPPPPDGPALKPGAFHIDGGAYVTLYPSVNYLAVMVYLSDAPEHGGATVIRPGSHRQVFQHWLATGDPGSATLPALDYADPVAVPVCAGDAVFMHYLLVHSGSANYAPTVRLGLNTAVLPHPGKPYRPRRGDPTPDWTPLDHTLLLR